MAERISKHEPVRITITLTSGAERRLRLACAVEGKAPHRVIESLIMKHVTEYQVTDPRKVG